MDCVLTAGSDLWESCCSACMTHHWPAPTCSISAWASCAMCHKILPMQSTWQHEQARSLPRQLPYCTQCFITYIVHVQTVISRFVRLYGHGIQGNFLLIVCMSQQQPEFVGCKQCLIYCGSATHSRASLLLWAPFEDLTHALACLGQMWKVASIKAKPRIKNT